MVWIWFWENAGWQDKKVLDRQKYAAEKLM